MKNKNKDPLIELISSIFSNVNLDEELQKIKESLYPSPSSNPSSGSSHPHNPYNKNAMSYFTSKDEPGVIYIATGSTSKEQVSLRIENKHLVVKSNPAPEVNWKCVIPLPPSLLQTIQQNLTAKFQVEGGLLKVTIPVSNPTSDIPIT